MLHSSPPPLPPTDLASVGVEEKTAAINFSKPVMKSQLIPLLAILLAVLPSHAAGPKYIGVEPQLICEATTIVPGQTFTVALSMKHQATFHTYWLNPGMVGVATSLRWDLPEGFTAGDIQWQTPEQCTMVIYNAHGYKKDALLLVDITAPDTLPSGPVSLKARAVWMACAQKQCCNVGFEDLEVKVNTGTSKEWNDQPRTQIEEARRKLPKTVDGWKSSASRKGDKITLKLTNTNDKPVIDPRGIYFYSETKGIDTLVKQKPIALGNEITTVISLSEFASEKMTTLTGLLYRPGGWPGTKGQQYMPLTVTLD